MLDVMPQEFSQRFPDTMGDFQAVVDYLAPGPDEHVVASFPVFDADPSPNNPNFYPGPYTGKTRGIVFAIVPGAKDHAEALRTFLDELFEARSAPAT